MKLVANECANCRRPVGYVTPEALQIPTFCVLCAADKSVLKEWGHKIDPREKSLFQVIGDYKFAINRIDLDKLRPPCPDCGSRTHPPGCCAKDGHGG